MPGRDRDVLVSSDGGGEGEFVSEEADGRAGVVELERTQAGGAGVGRRTRRSIASNGPVSSPNWETSQSIKLAVNHAGEPTVEPDKVFQFASGGSDRLLTCLSQTHQRVYCPPQEGWKTI